MAKIVNGVIFLRKGDTETLRVSAKSGTTDYQFQVGDVLTFTVREIPETSSTVLLTKSVTVSTVATSVDIVLPATITELVAAGKYSCDIQLNSDGVIKTLFPVTDTNEPKCKANNWKNCVVEAEVTVNG